MAQEDEEQLTENEPQVNTISELPGRPFSLTMEVPLFLVMMAISLSAPAISNILLYRTCVHTFNHDPVECQVFLAPDHSNTSKSLEDEAQKYATFVTTVKMVIEAVGPAAISLFLGVWSDTYGRKPLVVWPLFGMSFMAILTVVYSMMENLGPWWYLLTAIPFSFSGGWSALFTGSYTYISDITTTKNRSIRMLLLELAFAAGSVLGSGISSYVIKYIGNVYLLLINAALFVLAYAFTNIYIAESLTGALRQGGITSVLDLLLAKETIQTCFKKRPNKGRAQIFLLTFTNSLVVFILYGTAELKYMYTREKFHWAVKEYSILESVHITMSMLVSLVTLHVFQKYLRVADLSLTLLALLSSAVGDMVIAFAVKPWYMYLGAAVSVFEGLSAPLVRSHVTKTLPLEDIAKVFTLICVCESLCPLIAPILYQTIYSHTITTFPGAIFLLSAGINLFCFGMIFTVKYFVWRTSYIPLEAET